MQRESLLVADAAAPPTVFLDWAIYLPFPANIIAGLALFAASATLFLWLRRRKGRIGCLTVMLPLYLYGFGNVAIVIFAWTVLREPRQPPPLPYDSPSQESTTPELAPMPKVETPEAIEAKP